jgi:nucleoid-associated protein YgaU
MGLFEFINEAGEKAGLINSAGRVAAGGSAADAAYMKWVAEVNANIKTKIENVMPGVFANLAVDFKDGAVKLSGECETTEQKEKAVLLVGNLEGIHQVNDDGVKVRNPSAGVQFYTIVKGDTLSKIAKRFYGESGKYRLIFEANKGIIKNANLIFPGQVIRIPPLVK